MFVITNKNGVIIRLSPTMGYQSNGNPLVDNGKLAIASFLVGEVSGDIEVPEGVAPHTHCWIDGEFSANPNFTLPVERLTLEDLAEAVLDLQAELTQLRMMN